ncbi:MAG: uracil-DNA glycosylase, partial [Akkermansiaceae bacterium]|nr:uracil-DNA glycosylase [Akkermansiaceae bacterium]
PPLVATGTTREDQLASLRARAETWEAARSLGTLRDTMVFATGSPEADLMLVGEAPGFEEERRREPFVGKAGQKLDQILKAMGLDRGGVYISNICKFRPAMKGQTTNNRKPTREEMDACLPFVRAEIGIVQPKCIVALGATAAQGLLESSEGVGRLRGSWHTFENIPLRVTYHPSYLLHNDTAKEEKRKVWEDMLTVMEKLGMPVSEKQRGFFGG